MQNTQQVTQLAKVNQLETVIRGKEKDFAAFLHQMLPPQRFVRIALAAVTKTPALMRCSQESLLQSLMDCAELGLEPGSKRGVYLIPYGNSVQAVPSYRGLMEVARRDGHRINSEIVRGPSSSGQTGDKFQVVKGSTPKLIHEPNLANEDGPITHVYARAVDNEGNELFEVMSRRQVESIRKRAKSANSPAWTESWDQMARKTVIRRLCNYLTATPALSKALDLVDAEYEVDDEPRTLEIGRILNEPCGIPAGSEETEAPVAEAATPEDEGETEAGITADEEDAVRSHILDMVNASRAKGLARKLPPNWDDMSLEELRRLETYYTKTLDTTSTPNAKRG